MRRPQFTLKTLFGLLIASCLSLGAWHLNTSYRQFIEVEPARANRGLRARGRFFIYDGPIVQSFHALVDVPEEAEFKDWCEGSAIVRRVGAGTYDFEISLSPQPSTPGVHRLRVWPHVPGGLGAPLETTFTVAP